MQANKSKGKRSLAGSSEGLYARAITWPAAVVAVPVPIKTKPAAQLPEDSTLLTPFFFKN